MVIGCLYALDEEGRLWAYDDKDRWISMRHPAGEEQGVIGDPESRAVPDPRNPACMRANPRGEPTVLYCPRTLNSKHEFMERVDGYRECIYCKFVVG